jgi:SpoIIAA-like
MSLYESDYLTAWWDDKLACLVIKRIGFVSGEEFKYHNLKLLEIIKSHKVIKMITDVRQMKVVAPKDQEWFAQEYLTQAHAAGLNHMAIIPPSSLIAQMSVTMVERKADGIIEMRYFTTFEDAADWIKSL